MPGVTVVFFDNALNSQNQDYLPSRIILQKEIIDTVITRILESDIESLIGLIPLGQRMSNDILTPTKTRPYLSTFLHQTSLCPPTSRFTCLFQADQSLHVSDLSTKGLIAFFCSPIDDVEELLSGLYTIASKGITIKAVCFGDAIDLGGMLQKEIDLPNFECLILDSDADFNDKVLNFLGGSMPENDPELEEAIIRSLQQ